MLFYEMFKAFHDLRKTVSAFKLNSVQADGVAFGQKTAGKGKWAQFCFTPKTETELSVPAVLVPLSPSSVQWQIKRCQRSFSFYKFKVWV